MNKLMKKDGFTLIELMIVVVIIGVLASVAVPQFLKYQLKAKSSESTRMIGGIKTATESFFAKYRCQLQTIAGCYAQASQTAAYTPAGKVAWVASPGINLIGFSSSGLVYFTYSIETAAPLAELAALVAGSSCAFTIGGVDSTIVINALGVPEVVSGVPGGAPNVNVISWVAMGDVDGDTIPACYGMGNSANEFIGGPVDAGDNVF